MPVTSNLDQNLFKSSEPFVKYYIYFSCSVFVYRYSNEVTTTYKETPRTDLENKSLLRLALRGILNLSDIHRHKHLLDIFFQIEPVEKKLEFRFGLISPRKKRFIGNLKWIFINYYLGLQLFSEKSCKETELYIQKLHYLLSRSTAALCVDLYSNGAVYLEAVLTIIQVFSCSLSGL